MNIFIALTEKFNAGRLRAIISSGQAAVLHRLAVASKDGDWIVREDDEALMHILQVLDQSGARYRFGAPLDKRWLAGGWSSHFEFMQGPLRVRTDFVSRPPRISAERLSLIWMESEAREPPFIGLEDLAELKKTNREKDYAILGELARKMAVLENRIRYSRSAREIIGFYKKDAGLVSRLMQERGIATDSLRSVDTLEAALDTERRSLIHANERRLERYIAAGRAWSDRWKHIEREINGLGLAQAHAIICERAAGVLPYSIPGGDVHG
ncbi:MAG: hypothetical protein JW768_03460 [Chitinispirillaceae bacterium]|nr:hypothetical protein [Chitinispirillaceae bacterium]